MPELRKVDILLVDDDLRNLRALEAMLSDLGQNLITVQSGREALRVLLNQDVAVILLDVQMPEVDGFETAALIRGRERTRNVPIIFVTAFNQSDQQVFTGYSLGAVDFIFKPIIPDVLRSKVSVFVELSRQTDEIRRQSVLLHEGEQKAHEQRLEEARRVWEANRLREAMEHERRNAATLAARAVELARIIEERRRAEQALVASNERLRLLSDASSRLLLEERPKEFLHSLYERLAEHLQLEVYLHYTLEEGGETLRLESRGGVPEEEHAIEVLALGKGVSGLAAERRTPVIVEHLDETVDEQTAVLRELGLTAFAAFPMIAYGRLIGTFGFGTRHRPGFQPDEVAVMQAVSDQAAMAVERDRLILALQARNDLLADGARRKDEFLALLGHELRSPLAPIMSAAQLLRRQSTDSATHRATEMIERQVRHMVRLVDDLLDVGRINSGKVELHPVRVPLSSIIEQALQTNAPLIDLRQHKCIVTLPPGETHLVVDPTRLTQVVANLLSNAAKYTDPKGTIWLTVEKGGGEIVFRVRDTGIGVRRELLSPIFELFVQGDRTADRSEAGLGLGLTLSRRLVELHGGTLTAASEGPGLGSEFTVRLPLVEAEALDDQPPAEEEVACVGGGSLRVLIVEDNADIRVSLRELIELDGHHVIEADTGPNGVAAALAHHPQLAFIDIGLPGFDGYQVARELRAEMNGGGKITRLIALTGYGQPGDRQRALEAGFDAHLVKPIDDKLLTRLLAECQSNEANRKPANSG